MFASLCLCCQSPALTSVEEDGYSKCSVEFKLGLEADVSAHPDDVLTYQIHQVGNGGSLVYQYRRKEI